jgi:hypothetical protein
MKRIMSLQNHKIHNLGILELSLGRPKNFNVGFSIKSILYYRKEGGGCV